MNGSDPGLAPAPDESSRQALMILPAALALLVAQYLPVATGTLDRLTSPAERVYHASLLFVGVGVGVLGVLPLFEGVTLKRTSRTRLLTGAVAALVLGAAGDVFVAVDSAMGSLALAGLAAAVTVAVAVIWSVLSGHMWTSRKPERRG